MYRVNFFYQRATRNCISFSRQKSIRPLCLTGDEFNWMLSMYVICTCIRGIFHRYPLYRFSRLSRRLRVASFPYTRGLRYNIDSVSVDSVNTVRFGASAHEYAHAAPPALCPAAISPFLIALSLIAIVLVALCILDALL